MKDQITRGRMAPNLCRAVETQGEFVSARQRYALRARAVADLRAMGWKLKELVRITNWGTVEQVRRLEARGKRMKRQNGAAVERQNRDAVERVPTE